jgi:hypothetical protein
VDIVSRPPSLVVFSELQPDSVFRINLSLTQNITDNNPTTYVNNAIVEVLNSDTQLLDQLIYTQNGDYSTALKPQNNAHYLFRIKLDNKVYWANETIPETLKCTFIDTAKVIFQGKQNFFQFRISIKDSAGSIPNYYGLRLQREYMKVNGTDTVYGREWISIETPEFIMTENPESKFSKKHLLFHDKYFNGLNQELRFGSAELFDIPGSITVALHLHVSEYSENAYRYYTSINEHLLYQNDPFSQPTELKGNVFGAFGAIVGQSTKIITLR